MGSPLRLSVCGVARRSAARDAWAAVGSEFKNADAALSRFRDDSELTMLNRSAGTGRWVTGGRRLLSFLFAAHRAQRLTDGRFDPRVLWILESLGERAEVELLPAATHPAERDPTLRGAAWLARRSRSEVATTHPIDSGGLGKGLALRWARRRARQRLPATAGLLIEAGGDLALDGPGPDQGRWSIGLEDPLGGSTPLAVIRLGSGAIATTSIAVRHWTSPDGQPTHHIIDPRTGTASASDLLAVSVAAPDPAWAEVWTKALFLAGSRSIGPEARARGMAAWWVEADGSLHMTPTARLLTAWTRGSVAA
jgi:thiamine biosynthesis lipoprotein